MKLIILCQEQILADGLSVLLKERGDTDLVLVGQADSGLKGIRLAQECRPDVALVALHLKELNGVDTTRRLVEVLGDQIRILILATDPKSEPLQEALEAGALGFVAMDIGGDGLIRALETVGQGRHYLCPEATTVLVEKTIMGNPGAEDPVFALLTPREREVLQLLAEGFGSKEVGGKLHISPKTVDTHRRHLMTKLKTDSLAGLVKHAIRAGLTDLKT